MRIARSPTFKRKAKKLKPEQREHLEEALGRFASDPGSVATNKLRGPLRKYWAFSAEYDLRIVFNWRGEDAF